MRQIWIIELPVLALLAINAWWDWKWREIRTGSLLFFGSAGFLLKGVCDLSAGCESGLSTFTQNFCAWPELLGGIAVGVLLLLFAVLSKGAVGKGDGLLLCVTGIYLGFEKNLALLLGALLLSGFFSALLLAARKAGRKTELPFAPFLLAAYAGGVLIW